MTTPTTSSVELDYRITGTGDPLIFISGISLDKHAWDSTIGDFADRQCITFDNRDVGNSTIVDSGYTAADMADDTLNLLDQLGIESADVVGHSLGGVIAQELCLRAPERVRSLVLVSTLAKNDNYTSGVFDLWKTFADKLEDEYDFARGLTFFAVGSTTIEAVGIDALLEAFQSPGPVQPREAFKRQVDAGLAADTADRLGQIRTPTLVVSGDEDDLFPSKHAEQLAAGIPGARHIAIPKSGHCAFVENKEAFSSIVRGFLSSHRPR